jgi:hypothetical protein
MLGLYGNIRARLGFESDWQSEDIALVWSGAWSNIETCTAVVAASIPAMWKPFQFCVDKVFQVFVNKDRSYLPSFVRINLNTIHSSSALANGHESSGKSSSLLSPSPTKTDVEASPCSPKSALASTEKTDGGDVPCSPKNTLPPTKAHSNDEVH